MILKIGGTIPCAEYGNLQVSWEVDIDNNQESILIHRQLDTAQESLLTRFEKLWAEYADKPMAKDVRKAREEKVENFIDQAGRWLSSGWITKEWHDMAVRGAPNCTLAKLNTWTMELNRIGEEKKKEATEKRKAERKESTSEVTSQ